MDLTHFSIARRIQRGRAKDRKTGEKLKCGTCKLLKALPPTPEAEREERVCNRRVGPSETEYQRAKRDAEEAKAARVAAARQRNDAIARAAHERRMGRI